jgi:glutaredoxin 3
MYTVFTKPSCTFCDQAKALLKSKNLAYEEVHLDVGQPKTDGVRYISRDDLFSLIPTARTMPQIMKGEELIGGFKELASSLK